MDAEWSMERLHLITWISFAQLHMTTREEGDRRSICALQVRQLLRIAGGHNTNLLSICLALQNSSCTFILQNVFVTRLGVMTDSQSGELYSLSDPSIGMMSPIYYPGIHEQWYTYYHQGPFKSIGSSPSYDLVVPTRMRWDDCFNHLSFQSLPLIGHVYEMHHDKWDKVHWHASLFTAALLVLLDIPLDRIIVQQEAHAKTLLLPWVSGQPKHRLINESSHHICLTGWCPPQTSTLHGVARRVSLLVSENLMKKFAPLRNDSSPDASIQKNLILYMPRSLKGIRGVVNDAEILSTIRQHIRSEYEIVLVNHTQEYKTIHELHASWYKYAQLFRRARVIIGPHGGAFNNMMWAPTEVDIIEFNEFPDDNHFSESHGGTPVRHVFLTSAWAKGITGKFFIIEPSMKHKFDMYTGKLRIAPYELFEVMKQIPGLLRDDVQANPYKPERHGTWPQPNPNYSYVPPPPDSYYNQDKSESLSTILKHRFKNVDEDASRRKRAKPRNVKSKPSPQFQHN